MRCPTSTPVCSRSRHRLHRRLACAQVQPTSSAPTQRSARFSTSLCNTMPSCTNSPSPSSSYPLPPPSSWHGRKGLAAPSWTPDLFFSTGSPCNFECSGAPARIAVCVLQRSRCCSNNRPLVLLRQPPVRASLSNHINSLRNLGATPLKRPPPLLQGTAPSIARAPQT